MDGGTWNPVTGCDKVSPGCAHCYAETFAKRFEGVPGHPYEQGFELKLWPERLGIPLSWRRPRMVFVNSMSDLFHERIPDEYVAEVFEVMREASQHTFQVLTKRHERLAQLAPELRWPDNVWMGVTIENRRFVHRADYLREVPAVVRFISAEPLLGPLEGPARQRPRSPNHPLSTKPGELHPLDRDAHRPAPTRRMRVPGDPAA